MDNVCKKEQRPGNGRGADFGGGKLVFSEKIANLCEFDQDWTAHMTCNFAIFAAPGCAGFGTLSGRSGFNVAGRSEFIAAGHSGFNVAGRSEFIAAERSEFNAAGRSGFNAAERSRFNVAGRSGFNAAGRSGLNAAGRSGFNAAGRSGFNAANGGGRTL